MKKYQLKSNDANSTLAFGVLCDEKEYKISWLINEEFGIELALSSNIQWTNKKLPTIIEFTCYKDEVSNTEPIMLIRSKTSEGHALLEFGQFDYLLIVGKADKDWKGNLRKIREIRGVFELDASSLSDIELL